MRIRCIKPEFWESESLGRLSREARLLFIGLFSCCDDSGRTRANSRLIASRLFPYDEDAIRYISKWMAELSGAGCIREYVVDGESFLDIPKWLKHQKIDKPSESKLPAFAEIREDSRGFEKNSSGSGNGNREEEQGTGNGSVSPKHSEEPKVSGPASSRKHLPDEVFLAELKRHYPDIDFEAELRKMDAWLMTKPGKKKTRRFVVGWLNRVDPGMKVNGRGFETVREREEKKTGIRYDKPLKHL